MKNLFFAAIFILPLCYCASIDMGPNWMNSYRTDQALKMDIRKYFNGKIEGWGILTDDKNIVIKRFTIKANGSWDGDKGVVQMQYFFSDGKRDSRTWLFTVDDAEHYSAIGHDVIGNSVGQQVDGVSRMIYDVNMMLDGFKQKINMEEISYNIDDKAIIMVANLKKSGLNKGRMIISLKKIDGAPGNKASQIKYSDDYNDSNNENNNVKKSLPKSKTETEIKQDHDQDIDLENKDTDKEEPAFNEKISD